MPFHERDELGFEAPAPLGFPARANMPEGLQVGPALGERLPDFQLPDQNGRIVDFHEDRGQSRAAVVFYRSAVW